MYAFAMRAPLRPTSYCRELVALHMPRSSLPLSSDLTPSGSTPTRSAVEAPTRAVSVCSCPATSVLRLVSLPGWHGCSTSGSRQRRLRWARCRAISVESSRAAECSAGSAIETEHWLTYDMVTPPPEPDAIIDPNEPVPDDPAELLPDAPEPLPPAPIESTPDDPGGDTGGVPEPV